MDTSPSGSHDLTGPTESAHRPPGPQGAGHGEPAPAASFVDTVFGRVPVGTRPCPGCGGSNEAVAPHRYDMPPWDLIRCPGCAFVYLRRVPDYSALFEAMAWERTTLVEETRRAEIRPLSYAFSKRTRRRLHLLPRRQMDDLVGRHAPPGNVLDLGCGFGYHLLHLPPGYVPYGVEISTEAATAADASVGARGGRVMNAPCVEGLAQLPNAFFSAVTLRSYLEHESRPREVLLGVRRVIAADGVAIVKVPNYGSLNRRVMGRRWCGFRWPDHVNYFTPRSLTALAASCGFNARFGLTGRLPTSDNMWALLRPRAGNAAGAG